MPKQFWKTLALTTAVVLTTLVLVVGQALLVSAAPPKQQIIAQVTNPNQISDVHTTDYVYEPLRSLIEKYGCDMSYPDGTLRYNRPLMRAELAFMLNACLQSVEQLISSNTAGIYSSSELDATRRLLNDFSAELNSINR